MLKMAIIFLIYTFYFAFWSMVSIATADFFLTKCYGKRYSIAIGLASGLFFGMVGTAILAVLLNASKYLARKHNMPFCKFFDQFVMPYMPIKAVKVKKKKGEKKNADDNKHINNGD